jgi:CelD/BcsL family acetyltransferase involved in cellulose biosynthesis
MRVQHIGSLAELTPFASQWDRLVEHSGYRLPFSTFAWSACWWRHLARNRSSARDHLSFRLVWDDRGELAAVAPFVLTERPAAGPIRMRWLHFLGPDPGITEVPGMICLPELERPAYSALLADLHGRVNEWHWIRWSGLKPEGIAAEVIGGHQRLQWSRDVPAYLLTLAPSWEEFRGSLPRNIKESLRKCYNSLKRDGHAFEFVAIERADEIQAALGHFFRLHGARADAPGAVRHSDMFGTASKRNFLIDICETLASRGAVRIFTVKIGGCIIAIRIGFIVGDTLYLYYSGYDPAWSHYSVMTTVVAESIKWAIASGLRTVNLSTGNDVSKTRWRPTEISYREAVQISPSLSAQAAHALYRSIHMAGGVLDSGLSGNGHRGPKWRNGRSSSVDPSATVGRARTSC